MSDVMLKRDSICPGCAGRVIWYIEEFKIQSDGRYTVPVVLSARFPFKGIGGGIGGFELFICKGCGLTELYAHGIEELKADPARGVHLIDETPPAGLR